MKKILDPFLRSGSYRRMIPIMIATVLISAAGFLIPQMVLGTLTGRSVEKSLGFSVGDIAEGNVVANARIEYIDEAATQTARAEAAAAAAPIFTAEVEKSVDLLILFDDAASYFCGQSDELSPQAREYLQSKGVDYTQLREICMRMNEEQRSAAAAEAAEILHEMLEGGIYREESLAEAVAADGGADNGFLRISVRNRGDSEVIDLRRALTVESIDRYLNQWVLSADPDKTEVRRTAAEIVRPFIAANRTYEHLLTLKEKRAAADSVQPVVSVIEKGDLILAKDYLITPEAMEKLRVLQEHRLDQGLAERSGSLLFSIFSGLILMGALSAVLPKNYRYMQYMLITAGMILLYYAALFFITKAVLQFNLILFFYFVPASFFTMLLTVIAGRKVGFIVSVYLAFHTLLMPTADYTSFIFILAMGITGTLLMVSARKRVDIFKYFFLLLASGLFFLLLAGLLEDYPLSNLLLYGVIVAVNVLVSSMLFVMLLPLFENVFNLPTDFRLLELTTMNTRILKRMAVVARGTYSHSVAVADLAESACEIIGANSLLARVGAYYHDIGKIDQPEYFIENQAGGNKHDDLKPSLSAAVIKSHVKVGVEKAKEIGLPQEVIDIIAEHHGNDIISYFYTEAVQKSGKNVKIAPEDFSYSGPPPMSREAAVVMLADSVDAASRTVKQPSTPKLEKLVWKICMDKIDRRQLVNCSLSLSELEAVRRQFVLILSGRYHTRIEYPEFGEAVR